MSATGRPTYTSTLTTAASLAACSALGQAQDPALQKELNLRTFLQDVCDHEPAPGRKKNDLKFVTRDRLQVLNEKDQS